MSKSLKESPIGALLGAGNHVEGDLSFEGRVRVDGHFHGRIYTEDLLELGENGLLDGEADLARAVIAGAVKGNIRVREHLLVTSTGTISGSLDAGVVELQAGAKLIGEVRIRGSEI